MTSIRKWLLVWQISALVLTTLLVTLLTYHLAWDGFNRIRDASLEQIAWAVVRHRDEHGRSAALVSDADRFVSQVWDEGGQLVFASQPDAVMPRQAPGLSTLYWQDEEWHVMVLEDAGTIVQVANSTASRYRMFNSLGLWLLLPFGVMIFVLGGVILIAVNQALWPLTRLRNQIRQRSPEHLGALAQDDYPEELQPVLLSLNELLARLVSAFAAQQRFVADAAHELRTPLTVVRLQSQLARYAEDGQARREALGLMQLGVDRASHLVEQLLSLTRFDPQFSAARPMQTVDLADIARTVVVEHAALAEAAGVDLGLVQADSVALSGDPEALRVMLGNLVDNAIRYAGRDNVVDVSVRRADDAVCCAVYDTGPGIPEAARTRVLEPFARLAPADIPGSGLGLAIVNEIVARHRGQLSFSETPGGGLTVMIRLPILHIDPC